MRLPLPTRLSLLACWWLTSSTTVVSSVFRTRAAIATAFQQLHPSSSPMRRYQRRRLLLYRPRGPFGSSSSSGALLHATTPRHSSSSTKPSLPSPPTQQLKFKNVEELLDAHCGPNDTLLIVFTAIHCGPCKLQKHELATFQQKLGKQQRPSASATPSASLAAAPIKLLAIDADKWPGVGKRFAVSKLPCLVLVQDKQVVARLEGLTSADALVERVLHLRRKGPTPAQEEEADGPEASQPREEE